MPQFVYQYVQLFSYIGMMPEDPGGDFVVTFRIDAPDAREAKRWGKLALQDYVRLLYRFATDPPDPEQYEGELLDPADWPNRLDEVATCKIGEHPVWKDPWKGWPHAKKGT